MIISNILIKFKNLVNKLWEILFKNKKLKQQKNPVKSRKLEPFDYYDNALQYIPQQDDIIHRLWLKNKYYRFCLYYYSDKTSEIILSDVKVNKIFRRHGYGNILLKHAKQLARERRFKKLFLNVKCGSWMEQWYKRNGFDFFEYHKEREGYVWLKCKL